MLKMAIRMNEKKIHAEKKYRLEGIYRTIDHAFCRMGFPRISNTSGLLVYRDNGNTKDYGRFGLIVNALKKQPWFMDNVTEWILYDSDDADRPDQFHEEDLLSHYRRKQMAGGSIWSEHIIKH